MKFHYLAALLLGVTLTANAEGYKDGIEYYKAGQYNNAITILTRNLNNPETDKAMANYYLGQASLIKDNKQKAKSYFDAGIAANPDNGYNYVGLGAIDLLNGNEKAAKDNFSKAQKLAKKNTEIIVDIARAYYNADPVKYEKDIDKLIEKAHKDSKHQEPSIYIFEGDRLARQRDFNGAAAQYEQAITFDNDSPEGYVKYANVYYYVVPKYAIGRLEELLQKQPNSALAQRELAEKYYDNGQYSKATAQYGEYIKNPNHFPEDKGRYAVLLFADGQYDNARQTAKEVLSEDPGDNDLTLERIIVRSLVAQNKIDEALAANQKMFANPTYAGRFNEDDYTIYADVLNASDQLDKAVEVLRQGMAQLPKEASIVTKLSTILSRQNKNIEAMDTYLNYMSMLKEPTTNDYNKGVLFAIYALPEVQTNDALLNKYGNAGLEYLNKINDDNNGINAVRRAQIMQFMNKGAMTEDIANAYLKAIQLFDADPKNADPSNESNQIRNYRVAYANLVNYYKSAGMKDAAANANDKLLYYTNLSNSTAQ